jgi:AraC-like DNA-binding protein
MRRLGINQKVRQLGKGKFRSDLAVQSTEQGDLFSDRFSAGCSMYLESPAGAVGLLFIRSVTGQLLASGGNVSNDMLVVLPGGSGTDLVMPDMFGSDAITIPEARFIETTEMLCPASKSVRPDRMAVIEGDIAQLHALRKAVCDLVAHPDPNPELVSNLIAGVIAWIGHSGSHWRSEGLIVSGARKRIAKLAQEFIEEHYREAVRIEDLCRVTGVGVRTLQRCFREFFDFTITEYLETVRLDGAYRKLAAADPSQDSISNIAWENGFRHLGRFSAKFYQRFGKLPREALAMRAGRLG